MNIAGKPLPGQIYYITARGITITEMRENLMDDPSFTELYNRGDLSLVWVHRDDIDVHNMNIELGGYMSDPDSGI